MKQPVHRRTGTHAERIAAARMALAQAERRVGLEGGGQGSSGAPAEHTVSKPRLSSVFTQNQIAFPLPQLAKVQTSDRA